jgi:hypothetical protein
LHIMQGRVLEKNKEKKKYRGWKEKEDGFEQC